MVNFDIFEGLVVKGDFDTNVEFSPAYFMNFVRWFTNDSDGIFETGMQSESDTFDKMLYRPVFVPSHITHPFVRRSRVSLLSKVKRYVSVYYPYRFLAQFTIL
jgi:hypothetical protein